MCLTFTTLSAYSSDDKLMNCFILIFLAKEDFTVQANCLIGDNLNEMPKPV